MAKVRRMDSAALSRTRATSGHTAMEASSARPHAGSSHLAVPDEPAVAL